MMNAEAVPWLVKVKEVGIDRPLAKVKAMFDPLVVVMEFPELYACCKVTFNALDEQMDS